MLPKKKRVTKGVFQVLMKEGKTFSTQLFLLYYLKSNSLQYAVVAPKNIFKNAVKRNKFRRIGYNILRSLPLKCGTGILMFKKQAVNATTQEMKDSIIFILKKTNCL